MMPMAFCGILGNECLQTNDLFLFQGLWAVVNNAGYSTFGEMEWVHMSTYEMVIHNIFQMQFIMV